MGLKIIRGRVRVPSRTLLHGVEGIGKTTLASQWPNPIVLDTEEGSSHLDVARVICHDAATLESSMHELVRDSQGFKSVVIDSADWAEQHLTDALVRKAGKRSVEDFGFGKGYTMVAEAFSRLLVVADALVAAGLHVVWVAHTKVARTSPPDQDEGYDRFEVKMTKQAGPLLKEWCDCILFANYKTRLVEGADGRMKAKGGKERVIYTERCAAWDAKNRYGLAPELPMTIEALAPLFSDVPAPAARPQQKSGWLDRVGDAGTAADLEQIGKDADRAVTEGDMTESQRNRLAAAIRQRHDELDPSGAAMAAEMGVA